MQASYAVIQFRCAMGIGCFLESMGGIPAKNPQKKIICRTPMNSQEMHFMLDQFNRPGYHIKIENGIKK